MQQARTPLEMVARALGRCTFTATCTPLPRSSALYTYTQRSRFRS